MLDLANVKRIAQSSTPQEMFAALVYQQKFNCFNGAEIINDLVDRSELWRSFLYFKPIYAQQDYGIGFSQMVELMIKMANHPYMPTNKYGGSYDSYPGDNLYILTEDDDSRISGLLDLGKKWRIDETYIVKSCNYVSMFDHNLTPPRSWKLRESLVKRDGTELIDGVVISFWWD